MTDESVTTAGTDGKRFRDRDAERLRQRLGAALERAEHRCRPVDPRQLRSRRSGRRSSREYLAQRALGAGHRAEHPVPLHRVPLRLELHLRLGDGHRAGARLGDDDRHLRARQQARRRRVPGRGADRHRLLGHGYDRHPRPDPREHQAHGGRAVRDDRQHVDQADDDALGQHARDGRHHAGRAARAWRREPQELRLRAARRHLLGRLPLDLLLGAAGARASGSASSRRPRRRRACRPRAGSDRKRAVALRGARWRAAAASREDIVAARRERRQKAEVGACALRQAPPRAIESGAMREDAVDGGIDRGASKSDRSARRANQRAARCALEPATKRSP